MKTKLAIVILLAALCANCSKDNAAPVYTDVVGKWSVKSTKLNGEIDVRKTSVADFPFISSNLKYIGGVNSFSFNDGFLYLLNSNVSFTSGPLQIGQGVVSNDFKKITFQEYSISINSISEKEVVTLTRIP